MKLYKPRALRFGTKQCIPESEWTHVAITKVLFNLFKKSKWCVGRRIFHEKKVGPAQETRIWRQTGETFSTGDAWVDFIVTAKVVSSCVSTSYSATCVWANQTRVHNVNPRRFVVRISSLIGLEVHYEARGKWNYCFQFTVKSQL